MKKLAHTVALGRLIAVLGTLCSLDLATTYAADAATLIVDDDGLATTTNCDANAAAFKKIQLAVNAAAPGDTVKVCPGVYNEQVAITKSHLTVFGEGAGVTILRPTVVSQIATNLFGNPVAPILLVQGATEVTVAKLTIDGSAAQGGATIFPPCPTLPFYVGMYYRNSSGTLDTAHITGITSATECAFAVRAENAYVVTRKSLFEHYGLSAIACLGQNAKCIITDNTIRGQGPVTNQTQAGIIIRAEAAGVVSGNIITDHFLIGAKGVPESSAGIFLVYAQPSTNPHLQQENVFINNQANVQRFGSAAAF